ncbi:AGE family epimerase/isomerase [Thiotrichales bacterium 19S3-7]|nr:AGE family epimerase/isomerase [Thiotrichales bacterium 19S3-7]MCF6801251.1 AGE family epimerase/isomerase [Thiotrichales bacterium 19S3-11]
MDNIQSKARQLIDTYSSRLKNHIELHGFCGEFIEANYEPELEKTRLLCQCRSIFFLLDYAEITSDKTYIDLAFELYIVIQANYFNDQSLMWSQYPGGTSNTLYEYAFLFLALSKLYCVMPVDEIKQAADRVNEILQNNYLSIETNFKQLEDASGRLSQNALMHLFEAYLEAYKVFKSQYYLDILEKLLARLMQLFYSEQFTLISEYAPLDKHNDVFEPGHSFEWAALLFEAEHLNVKIPVNVKHQLIAQSAEKLGVIDSKLVVTQFTAKGDLDQERYRIWPLFERLRYYAMTKNKAMIDANFKPFIALYFDKNDFPIEYVDHKLEADFRHIKATTSYHLINCFKYLLI